MQAQGRLEQILVPLMFACIQYRLRVVRKYDIYSFSTFDEL